MLRRARYPAPGATLEFCPDRKPGFWWQSRLGFGHNQATLHGGGMATLFARILAAIRGAGIPSRTGQPPAFEPQLRRARARSPAHSAADEPAERTARIAGLRVKRLRQIAGFYADSAHEAVLTVNDCAFLPQEEFAAAAELIARTGGAPTMERLDNEESMRQDKL